MSSPQSEVSTSDLSTPSDGSTGARSSRPPAIGAPRPWSFPAPERHRLDNGLEVHVYDLPGQHVITANLIMDTPLNAEPADLEGVATICARVLDEGTTLHPGEQFAELVENEGAAFGIDVTTAGVQLLIDVPVTRVSAALQLFAEAVVHPALAAPDVDRHVALRLAQIEQSRANSAATAQNAYRAALLSPADRASRMTGGEPGTVANITAEAVARHHRSTYGPRGAHLVLAGDFSTATLDPAKLAADSFGDWTNDDQITVPYAPPTAAPRQALLIDRPGAVAADVRLGGFGIDRLDPRWADATVASYSMGGAFLSRLNKVLREERGYTYGVHLAFSPMRAGGTYAVQSSFRTEVCVAAIQEARQLLDVAARPFEAAEVERATTYFAGVSPLTYATADAVADQAATQVLMGLAENYIDHRLEALQHVTPESATAAYRSLVDLDDLTLVVVGDAEALADPLREAGFPDLRILTR